MIAPAGEGFAVVLDQQRAEPLRVAINAALATGRLGAGVRAHLVALRNECADLAGMLDPAQFEAAGDQPAPAAS